MIDEIIEGFFGGIGRALGYIFVEILFEFVFYYIGYPIVKVITFGKYPKKIDSTYLKNETAHGFYVSAVGFIAVIITVIVLISLKN